MSFALFLLCIFATYIRPFELWLPQLAVYRPMVLLLILSVLAAGARAWAVGEVAARPVHFVLLVVFTLVIGISQVANGWAGGAVAAVNEFLPSALLMVLCLLNLTSLERIRITCLVITGSVVFAAALGIASYHTGYLAGELIVLQNAADDTDESRAADEGVAPADDDSGRWLYRLRYLSFLNDPNDFAQVMVMTLPFIAWGYSRRNWFVGALLRVPALAILGYAIHLTHSRGAILGIGVLGLLLVQRYVGTVTAALGAGLAVVALQTIEIGGRTISSNEESAAGRIDAWYAGWQMLKGSPLFGVGYGNFTDHNWLTAHNSFVLCFAELGLVGYFAWVGLIVITFAGLNRLIRSAPPELPHRHAAVMLRASLAAYFVCAWLLSRSYQPGMYILLALGIAIWMTGIRALPASEPAADALPLRWVKATLITMIVSIALVLATIAFR